MGHPKKQTKNDISLAIQKQREKTVKTFSLALFILIILFWAIQWFSRGAYMVNYFLPNTSSATYLDYFSILSYIPIGDPYLVYSANYPPMALLLFKVLFRFSSLVPNGTDPGALRGDMNSQLVYMIYFLVCVIALWEILRWNMREYSSANRIFFSICILFSGPMFFMFERGNVVFVALLLSLLFFMFFDSEKKSARYFAYVCLALAAGIKLYPAIFGIFVLLKRRYKESLILILLGLASFVLPFFMFGGLHNIKVMFGGIALSSDLYKDFGFGMNFSFSNLIRIFCALLGQYVESVPIFWLTIPIILCAAVFLLQKEFWKKLFAAVMLIVWIPSFTFAYTLVFLIIPLLYFIKAEKGRLHKLYLAFFVLILAPYALPLVQQINTLLGPIAYPLYWSTLLVNLVFLIFTLVLLTEGICHKVYAVRHRSVLVKA